MSFGAQWDQLLTQDWNEARIRVKLEEPERSDRAAQLLGPLQPFRAGRTELTFTAPRSDMVRRLLARLDAERIHGVLELVEVEPAETPKPEPPAPTLRESWEAELATLPGDWRERMTLYRLVCTLELWDWHREIGEPERLDRLAADMREITSAG